MKKNIPLVLLHAFPLSSAQWLPQKVGLEASGLTVYTPDQRGMGQGGEAPASYTLDQAAQDVAALMDQKGIDKIILGGLSMGGYVALRFAAQYPERLAGLILSNTKTAADTEEGKKAREALAKKVRAEGAKAAVEAFLPKLLGKKTQEEHPEIVGLVRALGESRSKEAVARALEAMAQRPDSAQALSQLTVPCLILVGQEDGITTVADAEMMAKKTQKSTLKILPGVGHLSNLEAPAAWNQEVLSFCQKI